ncbi:DUF4349 domain-containing protein [Hymenobacter actinosclerus]|uniref:DUF4349 domain-containing protein n=1 Tax=Hymenobacter actinosclerus TaxID=82805 RepID=A0A1I0EW57_9BACT|nr:DUF4349 domain-containing protein [Hymenobacter actinosclerus]SET49721.1 protein of unknown function [Hymenobacter actinosclerus]
MRIPILLWLSLTLSLLSCGNNQASMGEPAAEVAADTDGSADMEMAPASEEASVDKSIVSAAVAAPGQNNEPISATPAANRKLIYHATVRMKVADLARANQRMDSLTRAVGAFVEGASEEREDGEWRHEMKIRVAPARFQTLLAGLGRLGTVESKQLTTADVTAQHADITARLVAKRALEQRYRALLAKANKVADMLEIEQKMGEIREDIEATESRLRTLNDEVSYSTITLTYYQELSQRRPDAPVLSFGSRLLQSFYNGWELLTDLVLGLMEAWPLVLLVAAVVAAVRAWRRRRASRAK